VPFAWSCAICLHWPHSASASLWIFARVRLCPPPPGYATSRVLDEIGGDSRQSFFVRATVGRTCRRGYRQSPRDTMSRRWCLRLMNQSQAGLAVANRNSGAAGDGGRVLAGLIGAEPVLGLLSVELGVLLGSGAEHFLSCRPTSYRGARAIGRCRVTGTQSHAKKRQGWHVGKIYTSCFESFFDRLAVSVVIDKYLYESVCCGVCCPVRRWVGTSPAYY
jgi:hypothetical protein